MLPCELIAGTADGIRRISINRTGTPAVSADGLKQQAVRGIAVDPRDPDTFYVAAGLRGWGLHRTRDGGMTYESLGFEDYWCWDIAIDHGNPDRLLLGTEPPMLWESLDAGQTWRDFPSIDNVSSRPNWTFFHTPFQAGHLHGIAISPAHPERIVVGVEHGGLLLTQDGGAAWKDVMPGADLHRVEIDPSNPDRIFAGAGNGLFESLDGGENWNAVSGLRGRYVHGIVIDRSDTNRMFVYVDSNQSPVHRTTDGGETWTSVGAGLPASKPADPIRMHPEDPETLFYTGDTGKGSTLFISADSGDSWERLDLELPKVWRLVTID